MTKLNRTYILPWLIIMFFCIMVLTALSIVFDSDNMSRIWPVVTAAGAIAASICNLLQRDL